MDDPRPNESAGSGDPQPDPFFRAAEIVAASMVRLSEDENVPEHVKLDCLSKAALRLGRLLSYMD